jgi:NAD(P)-dependent dehydrogenase (short-subunit alcohol dehydrogenase family)
MPTLDGKVIIITGASAGIGAATALALAPHHTKLVLAARRVDRLQSVADQCRAAGSEALVIPCDVAQRADVEQLVAAAVAQFGRLDVMIANAGYGLLARVHELTEQQFDDIFATNVKGTWYAMQAAAKVMLQQPPVGHGKSRRGHIIVVSSGAARRGLPLYGAYALTKAAQLSLAEAQRVELRHEGIYVSSVHPMTTATEFFDVASAKSRLRTQGLSRPQSAAAVGRKIARLIAHPKPELWPAPFSRYLLVLAALLPSLADHNLARSIEKRTT